MSITLGAHQYGKAENRVVRIRRDAARHEILDLNVSTTLRGDFADTYLVGDQRKVLPTDSQKNTVFAYAKDRASTVEGFGLALARHFVDDVASVSGARVEIEEYPWQRVHVGGDPHDHTWIRTGSEIRTAAVTVEGTGAEQRVHVVSGIKDLVILKSTGSEYTGFLKDEYTTLPETTDRVLATSLDVRWRYELPLGPDRDEKVDWDGLHSGIRRTMIGQFAGVHSLALQQTLWHMGRASIEGFPEVAEVRLTAPNKHHFVVDLSPFGLENPGEVFHADDRPYGLIQATVLRDGAEDAGQAWTPGAGRA